MDRERFELLETLNQLLETLNQELADACNALLKRYQDLRLEIVNDTRQNRDLRFHKLDLDLPDLPYVEQWEIDCGCKTIPTLWERQMEHGGITYRVYLGYESEYDFADLPLRWLFDPDWEIEASTKLGGESAHLRAIAERDQQQQRERELAELARLQAKYKS